MAWKQRRSQYQDHFPVLEILPQKWELSIMQLKYWNPRKTETEISRVVSGRAYYGTNSVPDSLDHDLVTCPLYFTMTRSASPEGWTQTKHTQHFNGMGPEVELTSNNQNHRAWMGRGGSDCKHSPQRLGITPPGQGTAMTDNWHADRTFMCRRCEAICWIMYESIVATGWVACVSKKKKKIWKSKRKG